MFPSTAPDNPSISDTLTIRPFTAKDTAFILDSYTSCITKYNESIVKGYDRQYAHTFLEKILTYVLQGDAYSILVAVDKNDTNYILSYLIANHTINHIFFNYTKHTYRSMGIQKYLLMPILINFDKEITAQWPTKRMLRWQEKGLVTIRNRVVEDLIGF